MPRADDPELAELFGVGGQEQRDHRDQDGFGRRGKHARARAVVTPPHALGQQNGALVAAWRGGEGQGPRVRSNIKDFLVVK